MEEEATNSKAIEDAPLRAGDLVLCKLRNGYQRHVLVLEVLPYQLWQGDTSGYRYRYKVLYRRGTIGKMGLRPHWLVQRGEG